jgi:hypothetical protein
LSLNQNNATQKVTHKIALVIYPWKNDYTSEWYDDTEAPEIVYSSDKIKGENSLSGTGIHYVSISRNKTPGGTMQIDINGGINAEPIAFQVGAWCSFYSTAKGKPFTSKSEVLKNGILRFVGQIYSINGQYMTDGNGLLRKTLKISVREWSHVLHTPMRFHPQAQESNFSAASKLSLILNDLSSYKDALEQLGTQRLNVFQYPLVALSFVGYFNKVNERYSSLIAEKGTLQNFSTITSHLPNIHSQLVEDITGEKSNNFSDFMRVVSGVQTYENPMEGLVPDDVGDPEVKRPVSLAKTEGFVSGAPLYQMMETIISGNGATEMYTDIQYKEDSGNIVGVPSLVIRDLPFTLSKALDGGQDENDYQWTIYDDLPRTTIPPQAIASLSLKQGIENVSNLIVFNVDRTTFSAANVQTIASCFGTNVLPNSQYRYGGISREIPMTDIFAPPDKFKFEIAVNPTQIGQVNLKTDESTTATGTSSASAIGIDWWRSVANRLLEYYGTANMYFDGSITLYDDDYYLSVGNNLQWKMFDSGVKLIGHINQLDMRYQIEEGGRVTSQTTLGLTRVCGERKGKLLPLPTQILNSLYTFKESNPYYAGIDLGFDFFLPKRATKDSETLRNDGASDSKDSKKEISTSAKNTKTNSQEVASLKVKNTKAMADTIAKIGGDNSGVTDDMKRHESDYKAYGGGSII